MNAGRRRLLIAAGGIVALVAVATIVVVIAGGASSDSPGTGPPGRYSNDARQVPRWIHDEHLPPDALNGAKLFAVSGCTTCHTYAGSGTTALNAPDLTAVGSRGLGIAFLTRFLACPSCVRPGSPMPNYAIGSKRLRDLAVFLEASKGVR
jgi:hypothetical protein